MWTARLSSRPPAWWSARSTWAECRRLLPDHPWLGEPGSHSRASRGDDWVVLADVHARRLPPNSRSPRPPDRFRVEALATSDTAADVLRAGTALLVSDVSGFVDGGCGWPGVGDWIEFELRGGGARVTLETHEASADTPAIDGPWSDDVLWRDIMAAAVIVPANHPFARDPALVAAALERIGEAAALSAPPTVASQAQPPHG